MSTGSPAAKNIDSLTHALTRAAFVHPKLSVWAERDVALPVGCDRYLMRPSVQHRLIDLLQLKRGMQVLDAGMASGYSSMLLSRAGVRVYGIEEVGLLTRESRKLLDSLGFQTVLIRYARVDQGWPEYSPFNGILISKVIEVIPDTLLEQLAPGGIIAAAVGDDQSQQLQRVKKVSAGNYQTEYFETCSALTGLR